MKNSLIGYFRLNSNARDYSGYNRNGTATGVVYKKSLFGKDCAEFNGDTSVIDTGSDWIGTGDVSVSVWIKPYSFGEGGLGTILTNSRFILRVGVGGSNLVSSSNGSTACNNAVNSIVLNQWTHILVTRNSLGTTNFYINGELSGTPNLNGGTPEAGSSNVTIGNTNTLVRCFDGLISELKVYNKVLSFDEIQKDYRSTLPEFFEKNSLKNIVPDVSDSSLVGAWLNAGTVEAEDYSNHNNDGVANDLVFEKVGGKFNGSSSYIDLGKPSDLNLIDDFSISAWIKPYSLPNSVANSILSKRAGLDYQYQLRVTATGYVSFLSGVGQVRLSASTIPLNSWSHIFMSKQGSILKFYINGVLDATHPNASEITEKDVNVLIGWDSQVANTYWNGEIKDLRVYNEVKSDSFVKNLFLSSLPESDLVFSCFDGLKDLSKFERSLVNSNTLVGKEMVFNGSSSFIHTNSLVTKYPFTVSAWVKITGTSFAHVIWSMCDSTDSSNRIAVYAVESTKTFVIYAGTSAGASASNSYQVGEWVHLTAVYQDDTHKYLYKNGVLIVDNHDNVPYNSNIDNFEIGRFGDLTPSAPIKGNIKDLKVYNSVKSFDWVKKEYEVNKKFY